MNRRFVIGLATALSLAACKEPVSLDTDTRTLVRVAQTEQGRLVHRMHYSATLRPVNRARLAFQTPGVVAARPAQLGQAVSKGELLATLDNPELGPAQRAAAAALQETLARRDQVRRDLARLQSLVKSGAVGQDAVEQKQAELDTLQASLARAEANLAATGERLEDANLLAPFDGIIYSLNVEPGEFVAGGQPVMSIGGPERLELEVLLPAMLVPQVRVGTVTEVRVPQLAGLSWPGTVTEVSGIGDPATGLFPAIVQVDADARETPLRAGMLAQARFDHAESEGLIVPISAIVDPAGGNPRVYRVQDGEVLAVPVDILASTLGRVTIAPRPGRQLAPGDLVVTEGHLALTDGQPVRTVL